MMYLYDHCVPFSPAVRLEKVITRRTLDRLRYGSFLLFTVSMAVTAALYFFPDLLPDLTPFRNISAGIGILGLACWLDAFLVKSYHNSYYFSQLRSVINRDASLVSGVTYDIAKVVWQNPTDITSALVCSSMGRSALLRCGINEEQLSQYLQSSRTQIDSAKVVVPEEEIFSLIGLGKYLMTHDDSFSTFLTQCGVQPKIFIGSLRWVVGSHHEQKQRQRWWSKDNLSQTRGIGQELSYGVPYLLQKFSRSVTTSTVFSTLVTDNSFGTEKVIEIENILAKSKASNVLLLGEDGVGKMDLIMEVARRMRTGTSVNAIARSHVYVLDTTKLFATGTDKQSFEQTLLLLLTEAATAGKTIIVIEKISGFIFEAKSIGVHIPDLLDEFLGMNDLHFIVTDTPGQYHAQIESEKGFVRRFSEILVESLDQSATVRVLQKIAIAHENNYNLLFTYPALVAIAEAADRYIVNGVLPDKAVTLLDSITSSIQTAEQSIVTKEFVYKIVSEQTGVPAGPVSASEREVLLQLEDTLHRYVVGQQPAISAIAKTMRRSRAGIQSSDKPMGSFLFLGPTGVGKTETAKALASVFFGGEQHLRRIDMSEYSGGNSVDRFIGTATTAGTLPNILREHPYSVILLDEFEKSDQSVQDIFLQILDEGMFTDGRGESVNARNCIIIATSNAGSRLILETVQSRRDFDPLNAEVIKHIIKQGTYRPELINRFDNTIVFEPLRKSEQLTVAGLLLKQLYERIRQQGYQLEVTPELLELLVEKGYHPEFGARPMQRILQDVIEAAVAKKIIAGAVQKGDLIKLTRADVDHLIMTA